MKAINDQAGRAVIMCSGVGVFITLILFTLIFTEIIKQIVN